MKTKLITGIGMALCISLATFAIEIHMHCEEEDGIRTESGIYEEDYLFLGHELNFTGAAEDLIFLGKALTFRGRTDLTLFALCEKLIFSGETGNGIFTGGMNILIDGTVMDNSFIGCKSLHLSDSAVVDGNLFVGCAKLAIDGPLNGNLYAAAGEIIINDEINGDVVAYGGRIIIEENGRINGNFTYGAKEKLSDEERARVTGTITIDEKHALDKEWKFPAKRMKSIQFFILIGFTISFIIVGSLLLLLPVFGKLKEKLSERTFWNTALWGLVPVLMYPAIIVLCLALVVTIPFAFVLMLAFVPLFYFANVIGTTLLGKYIALKFKWNIEKRTYHFLIGACAGAITILIPFVNFLGFLFLSSLGWGVFISFLFKKDLAIDEGKKELTQTHERGEE
ncbi:MAG: hypothetical protein GF401_15850 [Chitinivibrionales bacterium]|nr:hypothetical protein [Chitinivibrionales bacterium]